MSAMRLAAVGTCLTLLGGAGGCVYYVGDGEGDDQDVGELGDVGQPPQPPDTTIPLSPAPSGVIQDCAYDTMSTWRAEQPEGPALYLAGLYETRSDHAAGYHPEGEAHIEFALPGSNVLALSAYEPTHWIVDVAPDAGLEKIVATGYHAQRVTAPEGVVVEIYDPGTTDRPLAACGYAYPDDGQGCETDQLIDNVQAVTGLRLTGFDGCYRATQLVYRP